MGTGTQEDGTALGWTLLPHHIHVLLVGPSQRPFAALLSSPQTSAL